MIIPTQMLIIIKLIGQQKMKNSIYTCLFFFFFFFFFLFVCERFTCIYIFIKSTKMKFTRIVQSKEESTLYFLILDMKGISK